MAKQCKEIHGVQNFLERIEEEVRQMVEEICNSEYYYKLFVDFFGCVPESLVFSIAILGDSKGWMHFESGEREYFVRLDGPLKDFKVIVQRKAGV